MRSLCALLLAGVTFRQLPGAWPWPWTPGQAPRARQLAGGSLQPWGSCLALHAALDVRVVCTAGHARLEQKSRSGTAPLLRSMLSETPLSLAGAVLCQPARLPSYRSLHQKPMMLRSALPLIGLGATRTDCQP